jgi:hypothetical protein
MDNKYYFAYIGDYNLAYVFWYNKKRIHKHPKSREYLKHILGKYYNPNKNVPYNLGIVDNTFYKITELSPKAEYIANNIFSLFEKFVKDKNYSWIPKQELLDYHKFYRNAILSTTIIDNVNKKGYNISKIKASPILEKNNKNIQDGYYNQYLICKHKYLKLKNRL